MNTCPDCGGTGMGECGNADGDVWCEQNQETCTTCGGFGTINEDDSDKGGLPALVGYLSSRKP